MSRVKILIVEDQILLQKLLKKKLENNDYTNIKESTNGEEAIKLIEKIKPDIILMDIFLEGDMDGIDAAIYIKEKFGNSVIYLTGNMDENVKIRALDTEPAGYIEKPVNFNLLYKIIDQELKKLNMPH